MNRTPAIDDLAELLEALGANTPVADDRLKAYATFREKVRAMLPSGNDLAAYKLRLLGERAIEAVEAKFRSMAKTAEVSRANIWQDVAAISASWTAPKPVGQTARALFDSNEAQDLSPANSGIAGRARIVLSLWLRSLKADAEADRFGYIWLLLEPILHIALMVAATMFLHSDTVFDMPAVPFAILGVAAWMCFRTAALAGLFGGGAMTLQLDHPVVRPFDVIFAKSLNGLFVYGVVCMIMMAGCIAAGLTNLPDDPLRLAASFAGIWLMGLTYGVIVGSLQLRYNGVRRVNALALRIIAILSGLLYVTEQLPQEFQAPLTWNPLIHVIQFLRSAWFIEYESTDASLAFAAAALGLLTLLALACLTIDAKRPGATR